MIDSKIKPNICLKLREKDKAKTYLSNLLKLRINPAFKTVYVYAIVYPSHLSDDNTKLKTTIIKSINRSLKEKFLTFITAGPNLFSPTDFGMEVIKFTSNLKDSLIQYEVSFKKSEAKIDLENLSLSDKFSIQV